MRGAQALVFAASLVIGCGKAPAPAGSVSASAAGAQPRPPPFTKLEVIDGAARLPATPLVPPANVVTPWRVWVEQKRPRQKKNPHWKSFPADQSAELPLEPGSAYRCILNPVRIVASPDEDGTVEAWNVWRSILCSSDGWNTWTEATQTFAMDAGGKQLTRVDHAELHLREAMPGGGQRETLLLLRSDTDSRGAAAASAAPSAAPSAAIPAPSASGAKH